MGLPDREDHWIPVEGERLAAWLYRPRASAEVPCVLMTNGFSATRHDGLDDMAAVFASAGLAVLVLDFRNLGDSDGTDRQHIPIRSMVQDRAAAAHWLRRQPGIDPGRLILWGFSIGGGTAIVSATRLGGVAALLLVAPFLDGLYRLRRGGVRHALRLAGPMSLDTLGVRRTVPVTGPPGACAAMNLPGEREGWLEFVAPGSPWRNEVTARSLVPLTSWRPVRHASRLAMPVWANLFEDDISVSNTAIERLAARAPRAVLRRYPGDHFAPADAEMRQRIADDQVAFLRDSGIL